MNADDLARLSLAKRAYRAAQPSEREVQTGVRRARLSLERRRPRRSWFSKGLVMVVLAAGGLAYAKPQALSEVVAQVVTAAAPASREVTARSTGTPIDVTRASASGGAKVDSRGAVTASRAVELRAADPRGADTTNRAVPPGPAEPPGALTASHAAPPGPADPHRIATNEAATASATLPASAAEAPAQSSNGAEARDRVASIAVQSKEARGTLARNAAPLEEAPRALSDWGRVGQALARGDEQTALAALSDLAESGDLRTRDKADLGRAQLLMTHGKLDEACALARSLTNRRAGGRIERQAQILLKSCH